MIFTTTKATAVFAAIIIGGLTVSTWCAAQMTDDSREALYFFDVGQGDSSLIVTAGGEKILIDGGPSGSKLRRNLDAVLGAARPYIDVLILTHPQQDHFAGYIDLVREYGVGAFIWSGRGAETEAFTALTSALDASAVHRVVVSAGDAIILADSQLSILGPHPSQLGSKNLNDTSVVALFKSAHISALYTGDIGFRDEVQLRRQYDVDVDILKVAHHGSRFSSDTGFLSEATPALAIIEVGKNRYGHPTLETLQRLKASGAETLRTDLAGTIKIQKAPAGYAVYTERWPKDTPFPF